jgi:hypothetical protein
MAMKEMKDEPKQASGAKEQKSVPQASKDEQIGFHKGALSTLAKEREEIIKILSIVEQLMQMHVSALKELGVDLEAMAKQKAPQQNGSLQAKKGKALEESIR